MTIAPPDYSDTVSKPRHSQSDSEKTRSNKHLPDTLVGEQTIQLETSAAIKKIENRLKRLADLGDINAAKQTQIYMEALSAVAEENPHVAQVLDLVQRGITAQLNQQNLASFDKKRDRDPTEGITDKDI